MLAIEWGVVLPELLCVAILVISLHAFDWALRLKRFWLLLPAFLLSGFTVLLSSLATMLFLVSFVAGCETHSAPVYSPSGERIAWIANHDGGALGGSTGVEVFSNYGLREDSVFGGEWRVVCGNGLHWTSNKELTIVYEAGSARPPICSSTRAIKVLCIPEPYEQYRNRCP